MSLFSGVAKLLNPFTWLHCNKKTEPPPQCEYELQEDDSFPVEEETPSSQLPLESDMENLQGEGDTAHIHIDDEVASIEQGSELRVITPTGEIVEPQPAMEGITLEAVQDQAAMGERNSNYEATMLPTAADSYKNDGARSNDEYYMVSSQTGAEYLEDSVVIIEQPKIIGVFGEPTV
ncbi:hypothetical protein OSTOST_08524 [Ostertagia ostertagi]